MPDLVLQLKTTSISKVQWSPVLFSNIKLLHASLSFTFTISHLHISNCHTMATVLLSAMLWNVHFEMRVKTCMVQLVDYVIKENAQSSAIVASRFNVFLWNDKLNFQEKLFGNSIDLVMKSTFVKVININVENKENVTWAIYVFR